MRRAIVAVGAAVVLGALPAVPASASGGGGCGGPVTEGAGDAVAITGFCFEPTVLYADTGQSITFSNRDPVRHNVLGANAVWGSFKTLREGQASQYAFDQPGVYPYVCAWHPGMVGAVVVGDGGSARLLSGTAGDAPPAARSAPTSSDSPWKAIAVASAGLLVLVLIGTAGLRRRSAA
jgi:plastocyanin